MLKFVLYSSLTKKAGIEKIAKELKARKVGVDGSDKITDLKKKLKEDEKQRHEQFLRRKLEEYGTDAGDRNLVEMLTCLKSAVEETDKDFNSAWDVDVDKMYLPLEYREPMNEE